MKFNIVLGNHPPQAINTTRDHTLIIRGGLEEAGHLATLSMTEVFHDSINVFYDYFTEEFSPRYFESLWETGYQYGLITTEMLAEDGHFNFVKNEHSQARIDAIRQVAVGAKFVWAMHEPSLKSFRALTGDVPCHPLPLGYCSLVKETKCLPIKDRNIDFLFFGIPTPYRHAILEKLASYGYVVRHIYDVPGFIRNSVIERSKINLSLRQHDKWDQPSMGRISYLVSNRCAVAVERTVNGKPYEAYAISAPPESFIETCMTAISDAGTFDRAEQYASNFERDLPMKKIMSELLEKTFG
jgi:hypothetical protein